MPEFEQTSRNRVLRVANRGNYDKDAIHAIVDEALICHVGFSVDGQPYVIPTIHARRGDELIFHGAKTSRLMKHLEAGNEVCVAITFLDGLVLARSSFHHSMNYRSAVIFGTGRPVDDAEEKLQCLERLVNHIAPGRWNDARKPNPKELNATTVAAVRIDSASAKVRTGGPSDDEEDYALPVWAGQLPIRQRFDEAIDDSRLSDGISLPNYLENYGR